MRISWPGPAGRGSGRPAHSLENEIVRAPARPAGDSCAIRFQPCTQTRVLIPRGMKRGKRTAYDAGRRAGLAGPDEGSGRHRAGLAGLDEAGLDLERDIP